MSAATVLTSSMSGMPVLSGTGGSLVALFRYIAPILGWSIEFDNGTDIIVIRPQSYGGGQSLFYRIDDRAARGGAAPRVAEVRAYESMSDINTGAGLVGPAYIHKSPTADTVMGSYTIAGDQYGFFLNTPGIASGTDRTLYFVYYLGFGNALQGSGESPVCVLFACGVDGQCSGTKILFNAGLSAATARGLFIHRNRGGSLNTPVALKGGLFDIHGYALGSLHKSSSWSDTKPLPSGEMGASVYFNDGTIYSCRGLLPAYSKQATDITSNYLSLSGFDDDGLLFYPCNRGCLLVTLSEDFRP